MSETDNRGHLFTLENGWILDFPTDAGGVLSLDPGNILIDACFFEQSRTKDNWDAVVGCQLRIVDVEGNVWQATSSFHSCDLLYPLIDLSRKEPARWLRNAAPDWIAALETRALLRGIPATYDDRFYRYVWIDNTGFVLQFKYLGAGFEIAALSSDRLLIRVSDLFCSWNPLPVAGPDGSPLPLPPLSPPRSQEEIEKEDERFQKSGESGDYEHIQPLAYEIEAGRLLFRNTHSPVENGGWDSTRISLPLVFQRLPEEGEAQRRVKFLPGHFPVPSCRVDSNDEAGFIDMTVEYWEPHRFQTDAGGQLALEGGNQTFQVRLDLHPNSITQPFDVLRCRVRVVDTDGRLWESVCLFTPEFFFEKLVNLDETSHADFAQVEDSVHSAEGSLLGVRALLADGGWRYILTGDLVAFQCDRQKPIVDVKPGARGFAVRISGLVGRVRPVETDNESRYFVLDPQARASEVKSWEQDKLLPPICFGVHFAELAFRNTTFAVDDGFWHHNAIPIPVVFTQMGTAEPGKSVRFVPDQASLDEA
jgi:hypothetical protein